MLDMLKLINGSLKVSGLVQIAFESYSGTKSAYFPSVDCMEP